MDINLLNTASDIGYIFLWIGLTILFLYFVFFFSYNGVNMIFLFGICCQ